MIALLALIAAATPSPSPVPSVRAGTAISVSGTTVSCVPASGVVGGCLTTGTQSIAGAKTFKENITSEKSVFVTGSGQAVTAPYLYASIWNQGEMYTPGTTGHAFQAMGMKSSYDPGSDLDFWSLNDRDGGDLATFNNGYNNRRRKVAAISPTGTVVGGIGQDFLNSGEEPAFACGSTTSGHACLAAPNGYYLVTRGGLGANQDGIETDGGRPKPDGGTWVQCDSPDGGCYYAYAGFHGNHTYVSRPQYAGLLGEWQNPIGGGIFTDKAAWIDFTGGFGHAHSLTFAQLLAFGPEFLIVTNLGQYKFGMHESSLNYAADRHRLTLWGPTTMWEVPITYDVLSVHGGEAAPQAFESGSSTFIAGAKGVSFTTNFNGTPKCWCVDTTAANGCFTGARNTVSAAFTGTGTDTFDWFCTGAK